MLARFRGEFDGTVHVVRDLDARAIVFAIPRGHVVRDFLAFCESLPLDDEGNVVMDPAGPHLLMLDPSKSGPLAELPQ